MSTTMKLAGSFVGRACARGFGAALLAGLATAGSGCGRGGEGVNSTTAELAATASGVGTASDMSSAPELAGLMAGLLPPHLPDGIEGFRCDDTPTIETATVCDHTFPSSIQLDWTACAARPDRDEHGPGDGAAPAPAAGATSAGTVSITNTVSVDPAGSCDATATYSFDRTSTADVTTTETDGTSVEVKASVTSTSTRQPSAQQFAQTKTYAITRVDHDAAGTVTRSTQVNGQVSESFDGSGASPVRTIDGTLDRTRDDGTTSTLNVTGVVLPVSGECRWPTAGTIVETASDGTTHTLVFGPTCGQGTLDGATVTLPRRGIHLEGERHGGRGHGRGPASGPGNDNAP